jgi:hypothetical protein
MIFIKKLFNQIITKYKIFDNKKILGRWNIDYCDKKINNKIDLSNEDHCGPCGQYILDKTKSNTNNNTSSIPSSNKILNNNHTSNINNNKYENII